jgi:hypothetical protein
MQAVCKFEVQPGAAEISMPNAETTTTVMAGRVPGIHDFCDINRLKPWMAGLRTP